MVKIRRFQGIGEKVNGRKKLTDGKDNVEREIRGEYRKDIEMKGEILKRKNGNIPFLFSHKERIEMKSSLSEKTFPVLDKIISRGDDQKMAETFREIIQDNIQMRKEIEALQKNVQTCEKKIESLEKFQRILHDSLNKCLRNEQSNDSCLEDTDENLQLLDSKLATLDVKINQLACYMGRPDIYSIIRTRLNQIGDLTPSQIQTVHNSLELDLLDDFPDFGKSKKSRFMSGEIGRRINKENDKNCDGGSGKSIEVYDPEDEDKNKDGCKVMESSDIKEKPIASSPSLQISEDDLNFSKRISCFEKQIRSIFCFCRRGLFNNEVRLNNVENVLHLRKDGTFNYDYADTLDSEGLYIPDTLNKRYMRGQEWPRYWSQEGISGNTQKFNQDKPSPIHISAIGSQNISIGERSLLKQLKLIDDSGEEKKDQIVHPDTNVLVSSLDSTRVEASALVGGTISGGIGEDPVASIQWHHPIISPEESLGDQINWCLLERSCLKDKMLYGLFVKLIPYSKAESWKESDITKGNKVILMEYKKNRAKKLNGHKRFKFSNTPIIEVDLANGGDSSTTSEFFIEELEPQKLIEGKIPVRMMQYETDYSNKTKKLMRSPHVSIDSRRKYRIICHSDYWPIYEIWEMKGPNISDRIIRIHRGSKVPITVSQIEQIEFKNSSGEDNRVEEDGAEEDGISVQNTSHDGSANSNIENNNSGNGNIGINTSIDPKFTNQIRSGYQTRPVPSSQHLLSRLREDYEMILSEFSGYWQGESRKEMIMEGNNFVCTIYLLVNLPILSQGKSSNFAVVSHNIPISHRAVSPEAAIKGASWASILRLQRDYHAFWIMFVLQIVPYSEAYYQFLEFYSEAKASQSLGNIFKSRRDPKTGLFVCSVIYDQRIFKIFSHYEQITAMEEAALSVMTEIQEQYSHCYLVRSPGDDIEAIKSYIRIHSSLNDEMLLENIRDGRHQLVFRGIVISEDKDRNSNTRKILKSMENISQSQIQKKILL